VAAQDETALEAKQEVLADRLHRLQPAAVQPFGQSLHRGTRMRRLHVDLLPHEDLQPGSGAMQGISFGHAIGLRKASIMLGGRALSGGLNIAAVAQRTGVPADTLRKWEQRYGVLQPMRTAGGQRRYSERDVARLQWLCARLAEGYRIGEAAALLGTLDPSGTVDPRDHVNAILAAVDECRPAEIAQRLDQAFALNRLDVVLTDIVAPLLREIGHRWQEGLISVAEEHLVTQAVRARLGHLLADTGGGVRGVTVLACAPGERHELGLMIWAIALRADGWKVDYLGPDTPLEDAFALAQRRAARILCVSLTLEARAPEVERSIAELDRGGVELVVGGRGASPELAARIGAHYLPGDLREAVGALRRFAA
jgi:DNA-binding transcriptional MerR regulator